MASHLHKLIFATLPHTMQAIVRGLFYEPTGPNKSKGYLILKFSTQNQITRNMSKQLHQISIRPGRPCIFTLFLSASLLCHIFLPCNSSDYMKNKKYLTIFYQSQPENYFSNYFQDCNLTTKKPTFFMKNVFQLKIFFDKNILHRNKSGLKI